MNCDGSSSYACNGISRGSQGVEREVPWTWAAIPMFRAVQKGLKQEEEAREFTSIFSSLLLGCCQGTSLLYPSFPLLKFSAWGQAPSNESKHGPSVWNQEPAPILFSWGCFAMLFCHSTWAVTDTLISDVLLCSGSSLQNTLGISSGSTT